jgi:hypothetical protein
MTPPETRYAKSGDVRIAFQVTGGGPFDLVFMPGFVFTEKPAKGAEMCQSRKYVTEPTRSHLWVSARDKST